MKQVISGAIWAKWYIFTGIVLVIINLILTK